MPDYHLDPDQAPNWAFSPDHDIRCPECDAKLSGLNWKLVPTGEVEVNEAGDEAAVMASGAMMLVPCGHELSMDTWELSFSGRDRRLGTVIRTPKFQRKDGS